MTSGKSIEYCQHYDVKCCSTDMDIERLKYHELQKLAKSVGIRANMKVDRLIRALQTYYETESQKQSTDSLSTTRRNETLLESNPVATNTMDEKTGAADIDKITHRTEDEDRKVKKGRAKKVAAKGRKKGHLDERILTKVPESATATPKTNVSFTRRNPVLSTPKIKNTPVTPAIVNPRSGARGSTATRCRPAVVNPLAASRHTTPAKAQKAVAAGTPGLFSPRFKRLSESVGDRVLAGRKESSAASAACIQNQADQEKVVMESASFESTNSNDGILQRDEYEEHVARKKRKRTNTYELNEPTLGAPATPDITDSKRTRSSSGSTGIEDMINSMSGEMSSAERRKRLMNVIDKKVGGKVKKSPGAGPATQIPRFAAFLAKQKQEEKKPITPGNKDWGKVHKKAFAKFDSIDVYLEKKRKRAEELTASVKKARTVLHEVQEAVTRLKNKQRPSLGKTKAETPFIPTVISTKDMNLNFGAIAASDSNVARENCKSVSNPFKPTVTFTKNMNLNFNTAKTPVAQDCTKTLTVRTPFAGASSRRSVGLRSSARKSLSASSARKSLATTPFHFTGNSTLNVTSGIKSTTKLVFDLKASLARPITWKPHTGRLKPLDSVYKEPASTSKSVAAASRMEVFKSAVNKTRLTYSRQDRRAAVAAKRADAKSAMQMRNRGIPAARR